MLEWVVGGGLKTYLKGRDQLRGQRASEAREYDRGTTARE